MMSKNVRLPELYNINESVVVKKEIDNKIFE